MAKEVLYVPEGRLLEVITVIRAGLQTTKHVSVEVREQLTKWCDEEEDYMLADGATRSRRA